ncbi:hypothetical protein YC2023_031019 [Brassica napus]
MAPNADVPKRKTISPYDLTSGDNPGAVISHPLLNGNNYEEWAINFRMAVSSRKKFGFLDGTIPKPAADSTYLEDWTANNHLLVGWIKQTIDPKLRSTISTREVAKDLWDIIKKRFSIKSGARLQQLRNSLATCKQNGSTVDEYFGRLTKVWDGIAECLNTKRCECGKCTCDLNTSHEKEAETLRVHDFLAGLDDSVHGVIRSQICAISPLPDLDSVYQTVLQNEIIRAAVNQEAAIMSFASQAHQSRYPPNTPTVQTREVSRQSGIEGFQPRTGPGNRDWSRQCTVCGRKGQEASACFRVIGYPEWYPDKARNKTAPAGRDRGNGPRANSTQIVNANLASASSNVAVTDTDCQGLSGITDEQWQLIQRVINGSKPTERLSGPHFEDADWSG